VPGTLPISTRRWTSANRSDLLDPRDRLVDRRLGSRPRPGRDGRRSPVNSPALLLLADQCQVRPLQFVRPGQAAPPHACGVGRSSRCTMHRHRSAARWSPSHDLAHERLGTLSSASSQGVGASLAAPFRPIRRSGCDADSSSLFGLEARHRPLLHRLIVSAAGTFSTRARRLCRKAYRRQSPFFVDIAWKQRIAGSLQLRGRIFGVWT
jgi:hypothetical protein